MSSSGATKNLYSDLLGVYERDDGVCAEGRPVWKMQGSTNKFLFYAPSTFWHVYSDFTADAGWIATAKGGLSEIPSDGWLVYNSTSDTWVSDPDMSVVPSLDKDENKETIGGFKIEWHIKGTAKPKSKEKENKKDFLL